MKNENTWELGRRVSYFNGSMKKIRLERGMTQKELGEKTGITTEMISQYENMYRKPSPERAKLIADALGVKVEHIFPEYLDLIMDKVPKREVKYAELNQQALDAWTQEVVYLQAENADPEETLRKREIKKTLVEAFHTLSDREQKILRMRFGLDNTRPCTLEEVGAEFSVTRERIREIEAKALAKLRRNKNIQHIIDWENIHL